MDTKWMNRAECGKHDPEIFTGRSPVRANWQPICRSCPVVDTCLQFALINKERGIWGGTTYDERERLEKLPKKYLQAMRLPHQNQTEESEPLKEQTAMERAVLQIRQEAETRTKAVLSDLSQTLLSLQDIS